MASQQYRVEDFVQPQPERIRNAHVYHAENSNGHIPPRCLEDIRDRLNLLGSLPLCDWWVLELREEEALHTTLAVIKEHFSPNHRKMLPGWAPTRQRRLCPSTESDGDNQIMNKESNYANTS